jgi:DnaD/phage-associated family protein
MNYLKEINAFYDWLETNSISDSSIVLWHALMHINNKTGWVTEFAVTISTLETKTGLRKSAIMRARQRLQQMGRIDFRSRNGQMSALYKIIYFDTEESTQNNCGSLRDTNRNTNRNTNRTQSETQTGSITKLNKTKLNNNVVSNNAVSYGGVTNCIEKTQDLEILMENKVSNDEAVWQKIQKTFDQNIHPMTPVELSDVMDWLNKGFESEVIITAINIAVRENRRFMRYINGILMNWHKSGLKTIEAVEAHNREWQERYKTKGGMVNEGNGGNAANRANIEYESYGAGIGFKI